MSLFDFDAEEVAEMVSKELPRTLNFLTTFNDPHLAILTFIAALRVVISKLNLAPLESYLPTISAFEVTNKIKPS